MAMQGNKGRSLLRMFLALALLPAALAGLGMAADRPVILKIGGTGGAYGGMKALAQAYQQQNPQVKMVFPPTLGSAGGIKAVLSGAIDVALSTRPLAPGEIQRGAVEHVYARTPFLFATPYQQGAAASRLTLNDIAAIYSGKISTWPDGTPLRLVVRPEVDYDAVLLKRMSPEIAKAVNQAESRPGMRIAVTDTDNANRLMELQNSLGSISLAQIVADKLPLYTLSLGGVVPSLENLQNGSYPYSKSFSLVTGPSPKDEVRLFMQFVFSPQGQEILKQTGHLPVIHAHE
ncbi:MAG: PstS family phosphate ABC transporter substrate-binding protein [Desulfobaccales bacterium]